MVATAQAGAGLTGPGLRRLGLLAPAAIVAALFLGVVGHRLGTLYHWNPTGFSLFGSKFAPVTHPPVRAIENSRYGYDGQFFYLQARDPLLLHDSTLRDFRRAPGEAFRLQRLGYPLLAYVLALGQRGALVWTLVILNVLVVVAITFGFSLYATTRGWSGWWGLCVGLLTGLLAGTLRDLSDPLAAAATLGGLLLWQQRRRWWAAALLTLAVLAREPMALVVAALLADGALQARRESEPGARLPALLRVAAFRWPVVVIPALAYGGWKAYASARYGGSINSPSSAYLPPFVGVFDELRRSVNDRQWFNTVWNLGYLALMLSGIVAAAGLVWRQRHGTVTVPLAALLLGLSLLIVVFGDPWSYTRLSAPMFAVLLLGGLELRNRPAMAVCVGVAVLGAVAPAVPWLGSG